MAITAHVIATPKNTPEFLLGLAYTWSVKEPFHKVAFLRAWYQGIKFFDAIKSLGESLCYDWRYLFFQGNLTHLYDEIPFGPLENMVYLIKWGSMGSAPTPWFLNNSRKISSIPINRVFNIHSDLQFPKFQIQIQHLTQSKSYSQYSENSAGL